uniref:PDZ domain-containing protein n=2 Tax=Eptatretus burgeri TaxID=7764 RepID=A0A8C4N4K0_EPTBU
MKYGRMDGHTMHRPINTKDCVPAVEMSSKRAILARLLACQCLRAADEGVAVLDYSHCSLEAVPREVLSFERSLVELYLDANQIEELPRQLFNCRALRKLSVPDNDLMGLPSAISCLTTLKELDISKNGIQCLPENIKSCRGLSVVEASVNPITNLPEGFSQLVNLTQLYLNDAFLEVLPENFGKLTKLRILELRENHLKTLPKSMSKLTQLERLDLGGNEILEMPEVIEHLGSLKELWLDGNGLQRFPGWIGKLRQLTYLDISKNNVEELESGISGCELLSDLLLSSNLLQLLPHTIGLLRKLMTFRVDDNQLTSLPTSVGSLAALEEFDCSCNELDCLPSSLGNLHHLRTFTADENFLSQLPPEIGNCLSVTVMSLRSNKLERLPEEMGQLKKLRVLNLSDNRLKYLPFSFAMLKDLAALWLSDNQSKPLIPLQTEVDPESQQRVLTNYMFPQQPRAEEDYTSESDSFNPALWEEQRQRRTTVVFNCQDVPVGEQRHGQLDAHLKGYSTPFPDDLRGVIRPTPILPRARDERGPPRMGQAAMNMHPRLDAALPNRTSTDSNDSAAALDLPMLRMQQVTQLPPPPPSSRGAELPGQMRSQHTHTPLSRLTPSSSDYKLRSGQVVSGLGSHGQVQSRTRDVCMTEDRLSQPRSEIISPPTPNPPSLLTPAVPPTKYMEPANSLPVEKPSILLGQRVQHKARDSPNIVLPPSTWPSRSEFMQMKDAATGIGSGVDAIPGEASDGFSEYSGSHGSAGSQTPPMAPRSPPSSPSPPKDNPSPTVSPSPARRHTGSSNSSATSPEEARHHSSLSSLSPEAKVASPQSYQSSRSEEGGKAAAAPTIERASLESDWSDMEEKSPAGSDSATSPEYEQLHSTRSIEAIFNDRGIYQLETTDFTTPLSLRQASHSSAERLEEGESSESEIAAAIEHAKVWNRSRALAEWEKAERMGVREVNLEPKHAPNKERTEADGNQRPPSANGQEMPVTEQHVGFVSPTTSQSRATSSTYSLGFVSSRVLSSGQKQAYESNQTYAPSHQEIARKVEPGAGQLRVYRRPSPLGKGSEPQLTPQDQKRCRVEDEDSARRRFSSRLFWYPEPGSRVPRMIGRRRGIGARSQDEDEEKSPLLISRSSEELSPERSNIGVGGDAGKTMGLVRPPFGKSFSFTEIDSGVLLQAYGIETDSTDFGPALHTGQTPGRLSGREKGILRSLSVPLLDEEGEDEVAGLVTANTAGPATITIIEPPISQQSSQDREVTYYRGYSDVGSDWLEELPACSPNPTPPFPTEAGNLVNTSLSPTKASDSSGKISPAVLTMQGGSSTASAHEEIPTPASRKVTTVTLSGPRVIFTSTACPKAIDKKPDADKPERVVISSAPAIQKWPLTDVTIQKNPAQMTVSGLRVNAAGDSASNRTTPVMEVNQRVTIPATYGQRQGAKSQGTATAPQAAPRSQITGIPRGQIAGPTPVTRPQAGPVASQRLAHHGLMERMNSLPAPPARSDSYGRLDHLRRADSAAEEQPEIGEEMMRLGETSTGRVGPGQRLVPWPGNEVEYVNLQSQSSAHRPQQEEFHKQQQQLFHQQQFQQHFLHHQQQQRQQQQHRGSKQEALTYAQRFVEGQTADPEACRRSGPVSGLPTPQARRARLERQTSLGTPAVAYPPSPPCSEPEQHYVNFASGGPCSRASVAAPTVSGASTPHPARAQLRNMKSYSVDEGYGPQHHAPQQRDFPPLLEHAQSERDLVEARLGRPLPPGARGTVMGPGGSHQHSRENLLRKSKSNIIHKHPSQLSVVSNPTFEPDSAAVSPNRSRYSFGLAQGLIPTCADPHTGSRAPSPYRHGARSVPPSRPHSALGMAKTPGKEELIDLLLQNLSEQASRPPLDYMSQQMVLPPVPQSARPQATPAMYQMPLQHKPHHHSQHSLLPGAVSTSSSAAAQSQHAMMSGRSLRQLGLPMSGGQACSAVPHGMPQYSPMHGALSSRCQPAPGSALGLGSVSPHGALANLYGPPPTARTPTGLPVQICVRLMKNSGLGFSITGGIKGQGNPFKPNDTGIFVTRVQPDGPASHLLRPGDKILKANGYNFAQLDHDQAVALLKSFQNIVELVVLRDAA